MNFVKTPLSRFADVVNEHYARRPDLLAALMERMGAHHIRAGNREIRCTCPIHGGSNPQGFSLWFDRGFVTWKCHTDCRDTGLLSKLVMKRYACNFEQATMWLAQNAGIQITGDCLVVDRVTLEEESIEALHKRLGFPMPGTENVPTYFDEQWVNWSQANLFHPAAAEWLDYLTGPITEKTRWGEKKRNLRPEIVAHFQLGFVPANAWAFRDEKNEPRGWFEDRICFPWRDINGRCIGFAGRRVDGNSFLKYKTYPGTKRALALWGLHDPQCQAEILRTRRIYIVEGYTDMLMAYQHGLFNTTALGGTEFTPQQLDLIKRWPLEAVVMYLDPDGPGIVAAKKAAQQMLGIAPVLLAKPPDDHDPSDLIIANEFMAPIAQATLFIPS